MTKFICISGQARHGKDTTATILKDKLDELGYTSLIIHYADLLKFICKNFFNWNGAKDTDGRTMLQRVGTECVRAQNPNYWVDFVINVIKMFPNEWEYIIIPDARFPNEIERISEEGFSVTHVRVVREGFENNLTEEQKSHKSETALNDVAPDFLIKNTTMSNLHYQIGLLCDIITSQ